MGERRRAWATLLAGLVALVCLIRLLGWWPCSAACAGGGMYARWAGIAVEWFGLATGVVLAVAHRWWSPAVAAALAWLAAGGAGFFLCMAIGLGLWCPFCLLVHAGLILSALVAGRQGCWPWLPIGLLAVNASFHHGPERDVVAMPAATPVEVDARADANRKRGSASAPLVAHVVLDLQCPHCAADWPILAARLAPAIRAGRVEMVLYLAQRRSSVAGDALARWFAAACQDSPAAVGRLVEELLGCRDDLDAVALQQRSPEAARLAISASGPAIAAFVASERARLAGLGYRGASPLLVIRHRSGGEALRSDGPPPIQALDELFGSSRPLRGP